MIGYKTIPGSDGWRNRPEYETALGHLQRGQWSEAAAVLMYLLADHPDEPALQSLLANTQLRMEAEQQSATRSRRLMLPGKRILLAALLFTLLLILAWLAYGFYTQVVTPSIAAAQFVREQEAVAAQAGQALSAGDYSGALDLFDRLAALNPEHPALAEGVARVQTALMLEDQYSLAQAQLAAGEMTEAQATLEGIQRAAPTYRDVGVLLARIERRQRLMGLLRRAGEAQAAADWETAVTLLEEARTLSPQEDRSSIEAELFEAYLALASKLVDQSQGRTADLERAVRYYTKALALQPQELRASTQRNWAKQYLAGYAAFTGSDWDGCVAQIEPLYGAQPDYLDGRAAQLLYDAYMRSAEQLAGQDSATLAWERYFRASQLQGVDTTAARTLAANLALQLTPTPSPTPTRTPAPAATPVPLAPRLAAPPATPVPDILVRYKGKILYRSTRGGSLEFWIMDADGANPFRVEDQARAKADYDTLRRTELYSPDGQSSLGVAQPEGSNYLQIFVSRGSDRVRLTSVLGTNYDPVWSPTGHWIALVSNHTGNDEIFIIGADGQNLTQLTTNIWEWDKHPSWSPDGKRLVFWSNRESGRAQIWVMNADGSGATNLSHNEYDEQDPVWIK